MARDNPNDPRLDKIIVLLVAGVPLATVTDAAAKEFALTPAAAEKLVAAARRRLQLAADYNRDEELNRSYLRLNELYSRSLNMQDTKTALAAQRELNKLLDLYRQPAIGAGPSAADQQTDAIAAHLLPLRLAPESYPLVEHARLAAQAVRDRITDLPQTGKPAPSKKARKPKAEAAEANKTNRTE